MNTENNILIAEFMGGENQNRFIPSRNCIEFDKKVHHGVTTVKSYSYEDLRYNRDWNWLMEVVEKINSNKNFYIAIDQITQNGGEYCSESYGCADFTKQSRKLISSNEGSTLIETVYNACIEFIKWYNQQKC